MHQTNSAWYFAFDPAGEKDWFGHFSPGELTQHETEHAGEWPSLIVRVDWWLGYLKREINEPDLWKLLMSGQPLPRPVAGQTTCRSLRRNGNAWSIGRTTYGPICRRRSGRRWPDRRVGRFADEPAWRRGGGGVEIRPGILSLKRPGELH